MVKANVKTKARVKGKAIPITPESQIFNDEWEEDEEMDNANNLASSTVRSEPIIRGLGENIPEKDDNAGKCWICLGSRGKRDLLANLRKRGFRT